MESNWVYMNLTSDEYDAFGYIWMHERFKFRVIVLDGPGHLVGRSWSLARNGKAYKHYQATPEEETMLMIKYGGTIGDKIERHAYN